jgi:SAM-dependent methyltransferase
MTAPTRWGSRAAELYGVDYAQRYREHDDRIRDGELVTRFGGWLGAICDRAGGSIDVLDLGCGTGRYFRSLRHVRRLVGIDVSTPMLEQARRPVGGESIHADALTLIAGDFMVHPFEPRSFDLVYSIGVLGEHSPFDAAIAARVRDSLKPGGRFAFTTVHPLSFSVPRTWKRRLAERCLPFATGAVRRALRDRLMRDGLYADEERLREVLGGVGFVVESIEHYESDVHLHCMAVARRAA